MKKINLLFIAILFITISCNKKDAGDAAFDKLSEEYLKGYLAWRPQTGTYLGLHEYDGKITDYSKASIDAEVSRLKEFEIKFAAIDSASLSSKKYYDWQMLKLAVKNELFGIEDLHYFTKNPMAYAGAIDVNIYVKRNFAPIEQQIKSIIAIEKEAPKLYEAAKANLADSLSKPHTELAIAIAKGSASFLEKDLLVALKDVKDSLLMKELKEVNQKAIEAINDYAAFLEKEKLPKVHTNYAIGEDNYRKMLLYGEGITMSPDEILAIGIKELAKEQAAFDAAAKIIDPTKKEIDVNNDMKKEHSTAEK